MTAPNWVYLIPTKANHRKYVASEIRNDCIDEWHKHIDECPIEGLIFPVKTIEDIQQITKAIRKLLKGE